MDGKNPFFAPYDTPHEATPFDLIDASHFLPAIERGIALADKEMEAIAANPEAPTFGNTIEAMECGDKTLERAQATMYNLLSANTSDQLQEVAETAAPLIAKHSADILLNERLFARVKAVHDAAPKLDEEQQTLLDETFETFVRSGALLSPGDKERFRAITQELSTLSLRFQQNLLEATNAFFLHITAPEELDGLPELHRTQAEEEARRRGLNGWCITLQAPSYGPFLTYATNRRLRRKLYMAYNTRCANNSTTGNLPIVRQIVNLKGELARLLGYASYADYALKQRMAGNKEAVMKLLNELLAAFRPQAVRELEEVRDKAHRMEGSDFELQSWDFSFYSHKLQRERYDFDSEMLRPYLELSRVKQGVFGLATTLYGITFHPSALPLYHPEVEVYEVRDRDGAFLALLYADFHPRATKKGGAWMTEYKEQWREADGVDSRPHVSVTMNLTRPAGDKPALLTLGEVSTFLHEFGHALHGIFSKCRYASLSGTNVKWDFVELPSQLMENFATDKTFLHSFARHYQTGEPLPDELIDRMTRARNFLAADTCLRQVSLGLLDMAFYSLESPLENDVRQFEREAWSRAVLLPASKECCMAAQFGHIMAGGYSAGYYSYKWAEVLDADAFELFKEHGTLSPEVAERFRRTILERGGTANPATLYRNFRGREPSIAPLLRRAGITTVPQQ